MTYCLLFTCAGGELGPYFLSLVRASKRHDVRVVGVDAGQTAASCRTADAFYPVPFGNSPNYVDAIVDIIRRENVNLVLPASDEEAITLSKNRERIEAAGARLACTDFQTLSIFSNKIATYERLAAAGFHMPIWSQCRTKDEILAAAEMLLASHGACVVKPAISRGGRGVCVIRSGASPDPVAGRQVHMNMEDFVALHLEKTVAQQPVLVMQSLEPPIFDIDMLAWNGQPVRVVARRRVDPMLPNEGHIIIADEKLETLGRRLIQEFSLSWLYDCDVMLDQNGEPCILEVNPRPSGSVSATITAGVPLADDLISLAKGEPVPKVDMPYGRVVVPIKALTLSASRG